MPKYDSLIFDLDGTLWDAVDAYVEGWNVLFSKMNIDRSLERAWFIEMVGWNPNDFLKRMLPNHILNDAILLYDRAGDEQEALLKKGVAIIYDGVVNELKHLHESYKLFIVSNCRDGVIQEFLRQTNTSHYFDGFLSHGENGKTKSINIEQIVEKYQLKSPVYIGDRSSDQIQSKLAGVPFVWASYGFGECKNYTFKIDQFNELKNVLK